MESREGLATAKRGRGTFFLTAIVVASLDQLTKLLVRSNMALGQSIPQDGLVRLTYVNNTGAAFGVLSNQTLFLIITAAVGVVAILVYYRYPFFNGLLPKAGLGLQLGGALGNLIDRVRFGYVTDFLDLRFWPVFNLADSAIVLGVALLAYFLLFASPRPSPKP